MNGIVQNPSGPSIFGVVFSGPATGPSAPDFPKTGGVYADIYNQAAEKIGLPDVRADPKLPAHSLVVRELDRHINMLHVDGRKPAQSAAKLLGEAQSTGVFGTSTDTPRLASEIIALRRDRPALAPAIEREVMAQIGNAGDQSRLAEDIRAAADHPATADVRLLSMRNTDAPVPAPITRATILADTNAIISDATSSGTFNVKGEIFQRPVTFSPERVVAQLQELAETNPQKAILLRAELTTRLTPIEAGNLNRMLAGDAGFFEGMTIAVNDPRDAAIGAAKGVANDGIGLVNMLAKGQALSTAEDTQQSADILRLFGNDKAAGQMESAAGVYRDIAAKGMLPTIAYKNDAQSGGANIATIVELATGVGGIAKGGAKLLAKKSDDIAEAAVRQGDEVASPLARQLDRFDTLAANAKLDMPHILDGHLNTKGKAVGFHARPDGIDPPNARMTEQVGLTNPQGVYVGRVEIAGIPKKQISTFFPDTMSAKEIEAAVRNAYADAIRNNRVDQFGRFTGDSGLNFDITGVAMNNEIPTAYPIMK